MMRKHVFVSDDQLVDLYYISFPNDRHRAKGVVICIMILECIQTSFITLAVYRIFASGFGNLEDLVGSTAKINTALLALGITGGIGGLCYSINTINYSRLNFVVIAIVQIFFAWRVYLLSKAVILSGFITVVSRSLLPYYFFSGLLTHQS